MMHIESIPFEEYINEFEISYIAELAHACREHIQVSGVKNCFVLKSPLMLPGETKSSQLIFQHKGDDFFECKTHLFTYPLYADADLKEQLLKQIKISHVWEDDSTEHFFGLELCDTYFLPTFKNINGTFSIFFDGSDSELKLSENLWETYEIEKNDDIYSITIPNVHTRHAIQRLLDMIQFVVRTCIF